MVKRLNFTFNSKNQTSVKLQIKIKLTQTMVMVAKLNKFFLAVQEFELMITK